MQASEFILQILNLFILNDEFLTNKVLKERRKKNQTNLSVEWYYKKNRFFLGTTIRIDGMHL